MTRKWLHYNEILSFFLFMAAILHNHIAIEKGQKCCPANFSNPCWKFKNKFHIITAAKLQKQISN